jgi:DNA-binding NtrC family response regulator
MKKMQEEKLVLISNSPKKLKSIIDTLEEKKYQVHLCGKNQDAVSFIKKQQASMVIIESFGQGLDDLAFLEQIKTYDPMIETIILSRQESPDKVARAIRMGAFKILFDPVKPEEILDAFKEINKKKDLRRETFILEKELEEKFIFHGMVGKNPRMLEIFSMVERVARYPLSILISGDTGTGKGVLARIINRLSDRSQQKLVTCDCPTIPENLFESELFGYVRGAFTGAQRNKKGLLEEAHKGTIFFDEIGHLPPFMQTKLLRVLEEQKFKRIGSNQDMEVDIRVLSATNTDLKEDIRAGKFREDLYQRIKTVEIKIPRLKDRQDDLPFLSRFLLNKFNKKFDKSVPGLSNRVKKVFQLYDWPGNVRELEKTIEHAVVLCRKGFIDIEDLPPYLINLAKKEIKEEPADIENFPTLIEMEKNHIIKALDVAQGNKSLASKLLGISRFSLYRKLNSLEIDNSD